MESKLCRALVRNARATWAELGILIGQSPPAAADKVHKLEERGVIAGYAARLEPEACGYPLTAFVAVVLSAPTRRAGFLGKIQKLEQVLEAHHIAGSEDYLLKVVARSTRDLDHFLSNILKAIPGVARTRTTVVLGTAKSAPLLPASKDIA
ncbi:MAG: Lrp/AsnC family transcriptional regulator [Bryobacter sp.]|nr:Lrp/AsnC family transcriptional regulator [Bryobacter sp.]